jgi:hypothetical protein
MLGPENLPLGAKHVRPQRLLFRRDGMHVGIEAHLAQDQPAALHAGLARAFAKGVEERAAHAAGGQGAASSA